MNKRTFQIFGILYWGNPGLQEYPKLHIFSGYFQIDGIHYTGSMHDKWGLSLLNIEFFDQVEMTNPSLPHDQKIRLMFRKTYKNRPSILYTLGRLPNGIYVGHYESKGTGRGLAKCIVTEVPAELMNLSPAEDQESQKIQEKQFIDDDLLLQSLHEQTLLESEE